MFRTFQNPSHSAVNFATISTCPLYCIVFYSHKAGKIYCYSINGQFLYLLEEQSNFLYNFNLQKNSRGMDYLVVMLLNIDICECIKGVIYG